MLGHREACRRHYEGRCGGDIERSGAVPSGATGIHNRLGDRCGKRPHPLPEGIDHPCNFGCGRQPVS